MSFGTIDTTQLEEFEKQLKQMKEKDNEEAIKHILKQMANVTLTQAIFLTSVVTGDLRRGWTGGLDIEATEYLKSVEVTKLDKKYKINLNNDVHYAEYVNYGHRQEVGRYVPAIGKKLKNNWVKGQFMAEKAVSFTENNCKLIAEKELEKYLKRKLE